MKEGTFIINDRFKIERDDTNFILKERKISEICVNKNTKEMKKCESWKNHYLGSLESALKRALDFVDVEDGETINEYLDRVESMKKELIDFVKNNKEIMEG